MLNIYFAAFKVFDHRIVVWHAATVSMYTHREMSYRIVAAIST